MQMHAGAGTNSYIMRGRVVWQGQTKTMPSLILRNDRKVLNSRYNKHRDSFKQCSTPYALGFREIVIISSNSFSNVYYRFPDFEC